MQNFFLYLKPFVLAFLLNIFIIPVVINFSRRYRIFDKNGGRKIHKGEISRLGGLGIIAAFWLAVFISGSLVFDGVKTGMIICSLLIFLFGFWDDIKSFSWKKQMAFQALIALIMIYFGLSVDYIANPFGGDEFRLDGWVIAGFSVLESVFVIVWIMGFMNVVNWLDGLDGLAGGVGAISAATLFALSISALVNQPPLAVMAIALAGALLGFLAYNFHPAKIFMGSSGSYFIGFMLSVLAIFSGGKIATAFLVMGFPILDAMWVVIKRLSEGRSPFEGDHSHLQYNLIDKGWSQRKTVLFICSVSAIFGFAGLAFQGLYKFIALIILFGAVSLFIMKVKFKR